MSRSVLLRCAGPGLVALVVLLLCGDWLAAAAPPAGSAAARTGKLTRREKRMLRWQMRFNAKNGPEYVARLRALGAVLAIPVGEKWKVVRELRAPAKLLDENLSKIKRIYWIDDNAKSVADVLEALGLPIKARQLVVFMPAALENKLFDLEKKEMIKRRGKYNEEQIEETIFRVVRRGGGHEVELVKIKFKRAGQ
jgi:hypothetical protein